MSDDADVVEAFLAAVEGKATREIARLVEGVSHNDVARWRRGDWERLSKAKLASLRAFLAGLDASTEGQVAGNFPEYPDVTFLKPRALAYYHQTLGEFVSRGWTQETVAAASRELTAFHRAESTLASEGPGQPDLSEQEQMIALRAVKKAIEYVYDRHARGWPH